MRLPDSMFERPPCPACGAATRLSRISPALDRPGSEQRSYECAACGGTHVTTVRGPSAPGDSGTQPAS
jgi:transposase-like protein